MLGTYFIPSLVRDVCHSVLTRDTTALLRFLSALELVKKIPVSIGIHLKFTVTAQPSVPQGTKDSPLLHF